MDFRKGKMIVGASDDQSPPLINDVDQTQLEGLHLLSETALSEAVEDSDSDSDSDSDHNSFSQQCRNQREQVDQMIKSHCEGLKSFVPGPLRSRAGTAANATEQMRFEELEEELSRTREWEKAAAGYKAHAEWLRTSVRIMERMNLVMTMNLDEARRAAEENESSEAESSIAVTGRARRKPVIITCRACKKRSASFILLPCRHLCVCTRCKRDTVDCPMCGRRRTSIVQIQFMSSS